MALKTILKIGNLYVLVLLSTILQACSGGDLESTSLGLYIPAPDVFQGQKTEKIKVNSITKKANFEVSCDSYSRRLEVSFDRETWNLFDSIECREGRALVSGDLSVFGGAFVRVVSDRGYSKERAVLFVKGSVLAPEQFVAFESYGGYTNTLESSVLLSSKFYILNEDSTQGIETYEASHYYLTETPGCGSDGNWKSFKDKIPYRLRNSNTNNTVYIKYRDFSFNESACLSASVVHDSVAPFISVASVVMPIGVVTSNAFSLTILGGGDYHQMLIAPNSYCSGSDWKDAQMNVSGVDVPFYNQANFISVQLRDRARNLSNCFLLSFVHDNLPPAVPTLNLQYPVSNNSTIATPYYAVAGLSIGDHWSFYSDSSCEASMGAGMVSTTPFSFIPTFVNNGMYEFYANFRDQAQNETGCVGPLAVYTYDTLPPVLSLMQTSSSPLPVGSSNQTLFNVIAVASSDASDYFYKYGVSSNVNCNLEAGYSAAVDILSPVVLDLLSLDDGQITVCAKAKDLAGNYSLPVSYTWGKVTSVSLAELSGAPNVLSNTKILDIQVSGHEIISYRYKVGTLPSTDCSTLTGYSSSDIPVASKINHNITALADGEIKLCVLGKNSAGLEQPTSLVTEAVWIKDTTGPTVTLVTSPAAGYYYLGMNMPFLLTFNEEVFVKNNPTMTVQLSGADRAVSYNKRVDSKKLEFVYVVGLDDSSGGLTYKSNLGIPVGTLVDKAGNSVQVQNVTGQTSGIFIYSVKPLYGWELTEVSAQGDDPFVNLTITASEPLAMDNSISLYIEKPVPAGGSGTPIAEQGVDFNYLNRTVLFPANATSVAVIIPLLKNTSLQEVRSLIISLRGTNLGEIDPGKQIARVLIRPSGASGSGDAVKLSGFGKDTGSICFLNANQSLYCIGNNSNGMTFQDITTGVQKSSKWVMSDVLDIKRHSNAVKTTLIKKSDNRYYDNKSPLNLPLGDYEIFENISKYCFKNNSQQVYCYGAALDNATGTGLIKSDVERVPALDGLTQLIFSNSVNCGVGDFDLNALTPLTVKCWGYGMLGTGSSGTSHSPMEIAGLRGIKGLAAASGTFCAWGDFDNQTSTPDTIKCWGSGDYGKVGSGNNTHQLSPREIVNSAGASKVVAGNLHFCALGEFEISSSGNEVMCWGYGGYGQMGTGVALSENAPTIISTFSGLTNIYATANTVCAMRNTTETFCWGIGFTSSPNQVANGEVVEVISESGSLCFKNTENKIYCRGSSNLSFSEVDDFTVSGANFCFIKNGSLNCSALWATPTVTEPTLLYTSAEVSSFAGKDGACIRVPGKTKLDCRGSNGGSRLLKSDTTFYYGSYVTTTHSNSGTIKFGGYPSCMLENGNLKCWGRYAGYNSSYVKNPQLLATEVVFFDIVTGGYDVNSGQGVFTIGNKTYLWISSAFFELLSFPTGLSQVVAGNKHFCGIENNLSKTVRCWGDNDRSALGNGTITDASYSNPVNAQNVNDIVKLSSGGYVTCGIRSTGIATCWGIAANTFPYDLSFGPSLTVQDIKISVAGRACFKLTNQDLYCSTSTLTSATPQKVLSGVDDFWMISSYGVCAKMTGTGSISCFGAAATDFGRLYDLVPTIHW